MATVLVPLAKGFEEIEAVSIIDVLRRAQIEVIVASLDDNELVLGSNGITIKTDVELKNVDIHKLDMVVLPGGWDGTYALADNENMQNILKEMDANKKLIGAICAAPFALNKAGVLKNNYTCYPSVEKQIQKDGYLGDKEMVVIDENIMTSRGIGTALCFALEIVRKFKGDELYKTIKAGILANNCQ